MSQPVEKAEFGRFRSFLWPIHLDEMKKFFPMGLIMFFIIMNYSILRTTKDALIVPLVGPEILPYLKFGVVMPAAILFVVLYAKLTNVMKRENLFHLLIASFITFFGAFAFIIFPMASTLHPDPATIVNLQQSFPFLKHAFNIWGLWSYSIFYMLSELWGGVLLSLLFWQFANEITRTSEAKRFYPMFGLMANFSLPAIWIVSEVIAFYTKSIPNPHEAWELRLDIMMSLVVLSGLLTMFLYNWMNKNVLTDSKYYDSAEKAGAPKKKKEKLSVGESFKYILTSKYIGYIALLVICYGVSISLVEIVWKAQVKDAFSGSSKFNEFTAMVQGITGIATILLIFISKGLVARLGWFAGAITTPAVILITGVIFFILILYGGIFSPIMAALALTPLLGASYVGALQNILSKGFKYALFDPTKEMSYIPLDQELKVKGKAAVEVIGGRFGKAGGGIILITMFSLMPGMGVVELTPYICVAFGVILLLWLFAVIGLSRLYKQKLVEKEAEVKA